VSQQVGGSVSARGAGTEAGTAVSAGVPVVIERVEADTPQRTREIARRLGERLRAADLVILSGELGAGKTTFTQGLAEGLGVRGPITSPTFVIARVHPPLDGGGGVPLVHVDAYRLGSLAELDDLDLDASVEDSVTVVEWGEGKAEVLAGERLEVRIDREQARAADAAEAANEGADSDGDGDGDGAEPVDPRVVTITAYGDRIAARFA